MRFLYQLLFIAYFMSYFMSCKNVEPPKFSSESEQLREDSLSLKLDISPYIETKLSPAADTVILKWPVYNDLKMEINRIENYSIQDVISNVTTLEKAIDSLQKTIPEQIDTFPVVSRVNVLNTKAKHLLMLSSKQRPPLLPIKRTAEELPLEFNALNVQLNEVFIELPKFDNQLD
jgi:hypothetical protein